MEVIKDRMRGDEIESDRMIHVTHEPRFWLLDVIFLAFGFGGFLVS